ncbi:MAG TPA: tryptophan synthase subunit alpha [Vicinamibacterales bacterium]|jgi:tryptophan synthase alpha chain
MSRLEGCFAGLRRERRTGLITYVTAGDPDFARSAAIVRTLDRAGADVIELGVPFSDPVADGPVIERASERARASGGTLDTTLELVRVVRDEIRAPVVLFTYANPVLRMGEQEFVTRAAAVGVDGVLVLDLPLEEAAGFCDSLARVGLDMIFLLSPTTTDARIERAAALGRGFLYAISRLGVTGARDTLAESAGPLVQRIRNCTTLPIALGFGISKPDHVRQVGQWADAAVVGSGLVQLVADAAATPDLMERVASYVRWMKGSEAPC